jgi:hypothetical protein
MSASVRGLPATLWVPTTRTVVVGLAGVPEDFSSRPADGLERLAPELLPVLEERISAGTLAWAAGHSTNWKRYLGLVKLPALEKWSSDDLAGARTLAVWVPAQKPLRVQAAARFADEAGALRAEEHLKKADGRLKCGREGEWLSLQTQVVE